MAHHASVLCRPPCASRLVLLPRVGNVKGLADDFVQKVYEQSVKMLVDLEYDGVKRTCQWYGVPPLRRSQTAAHRLTMCCSPVDGCSQFHNTSLWASLLNATGRPVLIENCHNSQPAYPVSVEVEPYNWFRSSTDINPSWNSIMNNLVGLKEGALIQVHVHRPHCP